jgi:hypothetical protein
MAQVKKVITVHYTVEVPEEMTNKEIEEGVRYEIDLAYQLPYGPELDVEVSVADLERR